MSMQSARLIIRATKFSEISGISYPPPLLPTTKSSFLEQNPRNIPSTVSSSTLKKIYMSGLLMLTALTTGLKLFRSYPTNLSRRHAPARTDSAHQKPFTKSVSITTKPSPPTKVSLPFIFSTKLTHLSQRTSRRKNYSYQLNDQIKQLIQPYIFSICGI